MFIASILIVNLTWRRCTTAPVVLTATHTHTHTHKTSTVHTEQDTHTHTAASAGHFCNETFPRYMVAATLWCPQMFAFKIHDVQSLFWHFKGADFCSSHPSHPDPRVRKVSKVAHWLPKEEKDYSKYFYCCFYVHFRSQNCTCKKVQMAEIWKLNRKNSTAMYQCAGPPTGCVQCLSISTRSHWQSQRDWTEGRKSHHDSEESRFLLLHLFCFFCFFFQMVNKNKT